MRLLIEGIKDSAIFMLDPEGRIALWNPGAERLYGYRDKEMVDRHFACLYLPEEAQAGKPALNLETAAQGGFQGEGWRLRKDGSRFWAEVIISPVSSKTGEQLGFAKLARDITRRNQAEQALRTSEERYRRIVETAGEGIWLLDQDWKTLLVNARLAHLLGCQPEEMVGRHLSEFTDEQGRQAASRLMRLRETGLRERHDFKFVRRDGTPVWTMITTNTVTTARGEFLGALAMVTDITQREMPEAALREALQRLQTVINASPIAILTTDAAARLVSWNAGAERMFGWTEPEVLGKECPTVPTEWLEDYRAMVAGVMRGKTVTGLVRYRQKKDGTLIHASLSSAPLRNDAGEATGTIVMLEDISERQRAEEKLHATQNLLEKTFASLKEAVFIVNPADRRILQCNRAVEHIFGYTPGEVVGQCTEMLHVNRAAYEEFARRSESALAQRGQFQGEFQMRRKDGTLISTDHTITPLLDEAQRKFALVSVVRDVTHQRRTEQVLVESRQRLRALSAHAVNLREEERIRISREIHDELGQMLTGIKMDLRWIEQRLDDFGDDRRVNPILDKLVATAELTDATVKTVQRIAAELRPGILDKLGLPMALQYEAARFEESTGIPCRLVVPGDAPPLGPEAATAFFRIFQEALTNVTRHAQATAVEAEFQSAANGCRLEIRDNGQGIAGVDLANPKSLGLLGMQERARLLRGDVSFTLRPGGGTIVTVQIPNSPSEQENI